MPHLPRYALIFLLSTLAGAALAEDAKCQYAPVAQMPIRIVGPAMVPVIDGSINGRPAVMLVDTGATGSALTKFAAERRGLPLDATGKYSYGFGGASVRYSARVNDFAAGPAHSGKTSMPVIGNMSRTPPFDAIVGAEFLLQADMEMMLAEHQLKFYRPHGCTDTFLAYWDKDAMEIPFAMSTAENLNPRFTVEVNGKKMLAMIDSGAHATLIYHNAAELAGVKTDSVGVTKVGSLGGIGDERVASWRATFDTFTVGSETIKNAEIEIIDAASTGKRTFPDVVLGRDFLRAHRVLFAMSQQRLYISYTGGEVFEKRRGATEVAPH